MFCQLRPKRSTKAPDAEPPKELDWDMWCGPAPLRPYNPGIHPKGFRNYLEYANGTIADWGIHWFDQVLWVMEEKYPKTVFSTGGTFVKENGINAPDTQMAVFGFENFTLTWEHKLCAPNANEDHNVGCYFYGSEGTFHIGWLDGWTFYPADKKKEKINFPPTLHQPDAQNIKELLGRFYGAIENNRRPVCDIEIGHRSTNMSLLGMLSYKLGRSVIWDGEKEVIVGDDDANKLLYRDYRGEWKYPGMETNELEKYIQSYFGIAQNDVERMISFFRKEELKKNDFFLKADSYSDRLGFIESGIVREFLNADGKEVTKWISSPGYFVVDLASFLFDKPARWNLQALTDCELHIIYKSDYAKIGQVGALPGRSWRNCLSPVVLPFWKSGLSHIYL
ncbi:MAG: cyclic nucleotide-binding domain-containing protein [Bacteroidia bacterium]